MKEYKEESDLQNLDMHERIIIRPGLCATRVIGGLIYETSTQGRDGFTNSNFSMSTTFVPYKSFKREKKNTKTKYTS